MQRVNVCWFDISMVSRYPAALSVYLSMLLSLFDCIRVESHNAPLTKVHIFRAHYRMKVSSFVHSLVRSLIHLTVLGLYKDKTTTSTRAGRMQNADVWANGDTLDWNERYIDIKASINT